ncbi:putative ubiquinone biosynthesis monooxygenase [Modicella reniformis]|uniref:Ubiquinone biosynthesis monooxygenase COQ6, mitochondrial n=1 Tax=Modicella reniformis TaxID=1440133 RepID=A0A9P6SV87_9FUNG|nr:putative ubiquinone biosynthesis monooxygenase [Modicella reniformis]
MTSHLLSRAARARTGRRLNPAAVACLLPSVAHAQYRQPAIVRFLSSDAGAPEQYDVVIVGGGIAGSALACALASGKASSTLKIALIEAFGLNDHIQQWSPRPDQYSNRVSSLTPKSVTFLKKIGIWAELDPSRVAPLEGMQVWDGVSDARITFDAANIQGTQASFLHQVFSGARITIDNINTTTTTASNSQDSEFQDAGEREASSQPLAWMTENLHVQYGLQKQILAHQTRGIQLDIFERTKVQTITANPTTTTTTTTLNDVAQSAQGGQVDISDWPVIELDNGKKLQTRLLVGADGVNSPVRTFAKIESLGWDYAQFGLVATLQIDPMTSTAPGYGKGIAWQRFLPTGPIAMLPLNNGLASLVWSTTPKIAQDLKKLPPRDFCALVNAGFSASPAELNYLYNSIGPDGQPLVDFQQEIEWRASVQEMEASKSVIRGHSKVDDKPPKVVGVQENTRAPFPLRMRNSNSYVEDRVVLVGDAAHTVHPLAGQGLNQGLADVECLARTIEQSILNGSDIDFGPVLWARSLGGLTAVDNIGPIKTEIMRFTMGLEDSASSSTRS